MLKRTEFYMSTGISAREFPKNREPKFFFDSHLNPATSYSPGPFPAKYHQRYEA